MIQAVIFDIDGTITDTNPVFLKALQKTYLEFLSEEKPLSFFYFTLGIPSPETMVRLGVPKEERVRFRDRWQELIRELMPEARLFPGMVETLETLTRMEIPLALVTSKIKEEMTYEFDNFGINHFFAVTVCADDVAHPKPAPDALLLALEKLSVTREQAIFVGESIYDIKAAKNAQVPFAFAQWGAIAPQEVLNLNPDYVLKAPFDLLQLIKTENQVETRRIGLHTVS
ncbi:MAG: HAD family hydrolase [Candidatus Atribacteria bacterium]|nr:HAD family hydrolase [Candidatus Atribacteria bacterium]